jgi:hypothetical protein
MKSIAVMFFLFSVILLLGTFKFSLELKRPGVYPPKQVLKKRVTALAGGGVICLLVAGMFSYFL